MSTLTISVHCVARAAEKNLAVLASLRSGRVFSAVPDAQTAVTQYKRTQDSTHKFRPTRAAQRTHQYS